MNSHAGWGERQFALRRVASCWELLALISEIQTARGEWNSYNQYFVINHCGLDYKVDRVSTV